MAEAKRKPSAKQVMDVQKSDSVAADATAKPVIVTHRQILRDPMVTSEATTPVAETQAAGEPKLSTTAKADTVPVPAAVTQESSKVIEPPQEEEKPADMPEEHVPEAAKQEPEEPVEPEQPAETPDEPAPTEVTTDAAIEAAAEEAEAKREAELQKLIDKKKYFLPINAAEQRRAEQFIALGMVISIILALAWIDVSLDAGLIHIGNIHPLTHFFSN